MAKKPFEMSDYEKFDSMAFETVRNYCFPFDGLEQHNEDFKIDYQLIGKGKLYALLELEVSTKFIGTNYNNNSNRITFVKEKVDKYKDENYSKNVFGIEGVPTFYCIFNSDCSYVAITKFLDIDNRIHNLIIRNDITKSDLYISNFAKTDIIKVEDIGIYFRLRLFHPKEFKIWKQTHIINK